MHRTYEGKRREAEDAVKQLNTLPSDEVQKIHSGERRAS
jgi:hypothetical protein